MRACIGMLLTLILTLPLLPTLAASAAPDSEVMVEVIFENGLNEITKAPCNDFVASIKVTLPVGVAIDFWDMEIHWDPTVLELQTGTTADVVEGPFMKAFGATIFLVQNPDNVAGILPEIACGFLVPVTASGSGILCDIEFHCKATGDGLIEIFQPNVESYLLIGPTLVPIDVAVNGLVHQPSPPPTSPNAEFTPPDSTIVYVCDNVTLNAETSQPGWDPLPGPGQLCPITEYKWEIDKGGDGTVDLTLYGMVVVFHCDEPGDVYITLTVYAPDIMPPTHPDYIEYDSETHIIHQIPRIPPTQEEAIEAGMAWLASQQNPDGSWGTYSQVGHTGFAVLKFETHAISIGKDPLDPCYQYYSQVRNGLDYIFANAHTITIGIQPAGNPDTDGDGIGVYIVSPTEDPWHRTYETGIAMMAIASSTHPGMTVNVSGSAVNGWTYKDVLKDAVDYLAYGQNDIGAGRGGWGYQDNQDWSDNSNTGYAVLGLAYAKAAAPYGFELTIPAFVKSELNIWIDYIQNDIDGDTNDGGSGYTDPNGWVNILKTGNLLFEMAFVGDTKDTPRVTDAINYIIRHWNDANTDPGWKGPPAHKQAMYCVMKGFESLGIHEIDGIDWQEEFCEALLAEQNLDGSWPADPWGDEILGTEWALLAKQKVVPAPPPPTLREIKDEIIAIEEKLDFWLPEIKNEIIGIEGKLDFWLPGIKNEVINIELKLDKWLPEIKSEIVQIEHKLDFWLPEIKKEIEHVEWKLEYRIDQETVEVEVLTGKDVGIGTQILKNKFVYYMMTTVAGQKCNVTKIEIEAESMKIDPSQYTVTVLKTGVYLIQINRAAVPVGTKLIIIQVQYKDPVSGVVYYGAAITTAFNV